MEILDRCNHATVAIVPPVHVWPGANPGFNLTGFVCYFTLPVVAFWHLAEEKYGS